MAVLTDIKPILSEVPTEFREVIPGKPQVRIPFWVIPRLGEEAICYFRNGPSVIEQTKVYAHRNNKQALVIRDVVQPHAINPDRGLHPGENEESRQACVETARSEWGELELRQLDELRGAKLGDTINQPVPWDPVERWALLYSRGSKDGNHVFTINCGCIAPFYFIHWNGQRDDDVMAHANNCCNPERPNETRWEAMHRTHQWFEKSSPYGHGGFKAYSDIAERALGTLEQIRNNAYPRN